MYNNLIVYKKQLKQSVKRGIFAIFVSFSRGNYSSMML